MAIILICTHLEIRDEWIQYELQDDFTGDIILQYKRKSRMKLQAKFPIPPTAQREKWTGNGFGK